MDQFWATVLATAAGGPITFVIIKLYAFGNKIKKEDECWKSRTVNAEWRKKQLQSGFEGAIIKTNYPKNYKFIQDKEIENANKIKLDGNDKKNKWSNI